MKLSEFSQYLYKLESTTKRLEITSILTSLISSLEENETDIGVYLSLGYLKATYENPRFNMAEKMVMRVLEFAYKVPVEKVEKLYAKTGDLGDTAYELAPDKNSNLNIKETHKKLVDIAETEGNGSQESKIGKLSKLLEQADKLSAKYLVRIVLGTTRLGFTELTVVDALNKLIEGNKETEARIESCYNIHPDIGLIARDIKINGLKGLEKVGIEVGVPILPQKAQRLADPEEIIERMGTASAEYKFDGTRVQLHLDRNKQIESKDIEQSGLFEDNKDRTFIKTFTRNLEETTYQYPDIVEGALKQIDAESVILDGEAIGYNKETGQFLPFQEIMQRKRKHGVAEMAKDVPLRYFVFDILYLNGRELLDKPLLERRKILHEIIKPGKVLEVDSNLVTSEAQDITDLFNESKEKGLEGLVIKKVDAPYQAGARAYSWVKLKRSDTKLLKDTVDTVVLGYYYGRGMRSEFGIGAFLTGIYDKTTDSFKTITKVGTGLKESDFINLKKEADKIKVGKKPANVNVGKIFEPDVWISPKIVVELGADEISKSETHSAGYALRFPRLLKFRTDKSPEDTTSLEEIVDMYKLQKRGEY